MTKTCQQWTFIGITILGFLSGGKLLAIYETKTPFPRARKAIKDARVTAEEKTAVRDSVFNHRKELANALIKTSLNKIGIPYVYGGTSVKGFDCSGFVYYSFSQFNIKVPRSSQLLADAGKAVPPKEARRGDILIFTGTNSKIRKPGHVGIVISKRGDPLEFVHASSNGGVKVSKVPGTNYERRFLDVRRVL